jgi:hypothetical protein
MGTSVSPCSQAAAAGRVRQTLVQTFEGLDVDIPTGGTPDRATAVGLCRLTLTNPH